MNTKQKAEYIAKQLTDRGVALPESGTLCIEIALGDIEILDGQEGAALKARKAKDPGGNDITWHKFFIDENSRAMALVEQAGMVRTIPATWVQFV